MVYDDKAFIGKKIKVYRKRAGLTQAELAEIVGISSKQLSKIEIARYIPSLPTFLKIITALKIDLSEFGVQKSPVYNPLRNEFIKFVYNLDDKETEFCYNMLKDIVKNLKNLKK